jgi:tetratricopeptide (TPR) repeat protein
VASGGVVAGRYVSEVNVRPANQLSSVLELLSSAVSLGQPVFSPAVKLAIQLAELGNAAQQLTVSNQRVELSDLLARMLRAVAAEDPRCPLVCLVDDADLLDGSWWVSLQFDFGQEIVRELPLVLVLAVDGPSQLGPEEAEDDSVAVGVARSLVKRDLADWLSLDPLDEAELAAWLGPMPDRLVGQILANAGTSPAEIAPFWESLREQEIVERKDSGWWLAQPLQKLDYPADALAERILAALGSADPTSVDAARRVFACAALEGNVFTAEAVAATCELDRDEVIDLLDSVGPGGAAGEGIVEELGAVEIENLTRDDSHHLWRYRFLRPLDRQVAMKLLDDEGDRGRTAAVLAEHLSLLYANEVSQVAPVIARLYAQAGDGDAAAHFHSLAHQAASHAAIRLQCDLLLRADTDGWTASDYRDASGLLLWACRMLEGTRPLHIGLELAERAEVLARSAGEAGAMNLALALANQGRLEGHAGNPERARKLLEEALRRSHHGSPMVRATALMDLGRLAFLVDGDVSIAYQHLEESLTIMRRLRIRNGECACLYELAEIAYLAADDDLAMQKNEEALRIARGIADEVEEASCLLQRGNIAHGRGEYDIARDAALSGLELKRKYRKRMGEAKCLRLLGMIEFDNGDYASARSYARRALSMQEDLGDVAAEAETLVLLAGIDCAVGELAEARGAVDRAAEIYRDLGHKEDIAECDRLLGEFDQLDKSR